MDAPKHRGHEEDPPPLRLQLRLGPRSLHLRARILSLEPVVLPARCWSAAWPIARRRWSTGARSAPPCWPTSRWWTAAAGATKTRPWSSARWNSGSSESPPMPTSCCDDMRAARRRLAGARAHHAAQLDRPLGRRGNRFPPGRQRRAHPRLHHARRHHLRRHLRDPGAGASAQRSRCSTRQAARAPRPWWMRAPTAIPAISKRKASSPATTPSIRSAASRLPIWVGNFVLMGYGTGAIMAVPGARRARLRILPQVRHRRASGDSPGGWRAGRRAGHEGSLHRRRHRGEFRPVVRPPQRRSARASMAAYAERARLRQSRGHLSHQGLGHLAPALLGHADSGDPLPEVRRGSGARGPTPGDAAATVSRSPARAARRSKKCPSSST